jgi:hypothetical protein
MEVEVEISNLILVDNLTSKALVIQAMTTEFQFILRANCYNLVVVWVFSQN